MRRAARTDANQPWILEALRKVGARVYYIKEPVDLLVGFRGQTYLLEIKTPDGRMTKSQQDFLDTWNGGPVSVVSTLDELFAAILGTDAMK